MASFCKEGSGTANTDSSNSTVLRKVVSGDVWEFTRYALLVKQTSGTTTTWSVKVEGSNDDSSWTTILTHDNGDDTQGKTIFGSSSVPFKYVRLYLTTKPNSGVINAKFVATK